MSNYIRKIDEDYNDGRLTLNEVERLRKQYFSLSQKNKTVLDNQSQKFNEPQSVSKLKSEDNNENKTPDGLKITSILSMIGTGIWIFMFIYLLIEDSKYSNAIVILLFVLFILILILKFIGALKMYRLHKSGFVMYFIGNIIFSIVWLISIINGYQENQLELAWGMVFSHVIFLIIFYNYKKQLIK